MEAAASDPRGVLSLLGAEAGHRVVLPAALGGGNRGFWRQREQVSVTGDSGLFVRRTFFLLPHDRPNQPGDPNGPYAVGSPLEAVDPRTIDVGKAGAKTPRSQATAEIQAASS
ncbi:DUF6009 family protein [Streptomyces sp. NPDC002624]